jgi:hypothetical protein
MIHKDLIRKLKLIELLGKDNGDGKFSELFSDLIDIRNNGIFYQMASIDNRIEYNYYFYYKKEFLFSFYFLDDNIIIRDSHRITSKIHDLYDLYNLYDGVHYLELYYDFEVFCKYYVKEYLIKSKENIMNKSIK